MELSLGGFLPGDVAGGEFVVVEFSVGGVVGLQVEFDVGAAPLPAEERDLSDPVALYCGLREADFDRGAVFSLREKAHEVGADSGGRGLQFEHVAACLVEITEAVVLRIDEGDEGGGGFDDGEQALIVAPACVVEGGACAQAGVDRGDEVGVGKRFAEEVGGDGAGEGAAGMGFFAGDQQEGDVFCVGVVAEGGEQIEASAVGHGHIADNEVGGLLLGDLNGA
ncbi:MAG: hypothetical protein BWX86_01945 [Verrucomicrobia bacterium ADurb.Bin122]|nr:MAG: hypothetical protein BWX86_01945 [Verrucomicrobia bacterium ADurb.Bin122]